MISRYNYSPLIEKIFQEEKEEIYILKNIIIQNINSINKNILILHLLMFLGIYFFYF